MTAGASTQWTPAVLKSSATLGTIQELLDAAIVRADAAEANRLGAELAAARAAHAHLLSVESILADTTAKVIKQKYAAKREEGRQRAEAAAKAVMKQAPSVTFTYGTVTATVSFSSADPALIAAAATAVRDAAIVLQQSWVGRVAAVRGAAMAGKRPLSLDGHGIALAIKNATSYAERRGLVKVKITKA